jgi:hypothetical protein
MPFLQFVVFQVPLTQNNQYPRVAYLWVACSELLHLLPKARSCLVFSKLLAEL